MTDLFNPSGENASFEVAGADGEQHVVGMPVDAVDRRPDRLLDLLRHPPSIIILGSFQFSLLFYLGKIIFYYFTLNRFY